jgi:uncharacterized protein YqgC (DUF456 family)
VVPYDAPMSDIIVTVIVAAVMVLGLAGTVLPILPGLWLIWAGAVGYGLALDFGVVGWVAMVLITALAAGATAAGLRLPQRQATDIGLGWWSQAIAAGCAVIGLFVIPIVGAPLGFIVGVVASVVVETRDLRTVLPSAWRIIRSMLIASGIQLATGTGMIAIWVAWAVAS